MSPRRPNDIGGLVAEPVDPRDGEHLAWQLEITATQAVLAGPAHRLVRLDELRRGMEDLGPDYHRLGYFERVVAALANLLTEKGVMGRVEIERRIGELRGRGRRL
jgi:Nitrile hydratase beta subunit